ncbi:ABC transporter substrate-binding protein [Ruixingdingia sedimenti]|uniref:MqnA/MqnD/SBP family protein n=1 Tax=Ruixingdingia sedimenti TaxID=3073604 RepID=A0ABU1FB93_9RHOB|nr:MqnA/MqnD/SBP family protein [Xinfangfangia sp. LG-4]MDR5654141.1 MqnA/MqnD/SBP family protein [Xinfangfangia sp. LG-4]
MPRTRPFLSRRALMAGSVGLAAALALPAIGRAAPLARLALFGPPAGPSITLAHAVATGALADLAAEVTLTVWRNPDELRAGLTSGAIDLSVVPVQAAANLYNRGMGLRLVNVMTDGLNYIVGTPGAAPGLAGLAGQRLAVPFVNDTPDFILRALLARHGLEGRVEQVPAGSPIEAAQMLLAGQIDAALLAEPAASVAVLRGAVAGRGLARVVDIQQEWGALTGLGPRVPQAGLAVTKGFSERAGDLIAPLHAALAQVTEQVNADPAVAALNAAAALELPAPVLGASIPHSALVARPAGSMRAEIEAMLSLMAKADPAIIGGGLPDEGFYALA